MKKQNKTKLDNMSAEQKMELFASMLDKAVLSYPNLMKRSFISGVFSGLGATIGVALIFIILTYVFQLLGFIPFVKDYSNLLEKQFQNITNKR